MNVIVCVWKALLFEAFGERLKCVKDATGTVNRDTANYWEGQNVTNQAVVKGTREDQENVKQESDEVWY
jgi:hypothetical protein